MPFPILPLLLAAGSVGAHSLGQKKVDRGRERALAEEATRREAAQRKTAAASQSTADLLIKAAGAPPTDQPQAAAAPVPVAPQGAVPADLLDVLAPTGGTSTIRSDERQLRAQGRGRVADLAAANAKLRSFGDIMTQSQIAAGRNRQDIDNTNEGVRNWQEYVLPQQLERANRSGRSWNTVGDVLQAVNSIMTPMALTAPAAAVNTAQIGSDLGASTLAQAGSAAGSAASDYFSQQGLLDYARNVAQPFMRF